MKLLIIDNNDSFTYNLVQMVEESGCKNFEVLVHDQIKIEDVKKYDKILISPGPSLPKDYPILFQILKAYGSGKSILGICLGMQAINEFYGGQLYNLQEVVHGQEHQVEVLKEDILFDGIPKKIPVGLYHSWAVSEIDIPDILKITSQSKSGVIMSIRHKEYDVKGLQFHPESIITTHGFQIIKNWLDS